VSGEAEIINHPGALSARILLDRVPAGWLMGLDVRGPGIGIGDPVSSHRVFASRGTAIERAGSRIRRFLRDDITPALAAWLDSLAPDQPDLFGANP
jgi:hypothetical protein